MDFAAFFPIFLFGFRSDISFCFIFISIRCFSLSDIRMIHYVHSNIFILFRGSNLYVLCIFYNVIEF